MQHLYSAAAVPSEICMRWRQRSITAPAGLPRAKLSCTGNISALVNFPLDFTFGLNQVPLFVGPGGSRHQDDAFLKVLRTGLHHQKGDLQQLGFASRRLTHRYHMSFALT